MARPRIPKATLDDLRRAFAYDKLTGQVTWAVPPRAQRQKGDIAGTIQPNGYIRITYRGERIFAHRLIWFIVTGEWPPIDIDHKDTVRSNNAWDNLRIATKPENAQNKNGRRKSSSGLKGVSWNKRDKVWQATIKIGGRQKNLGSRRTAEEAHGLYVDAARRQFGEFARS